MTHTTSFTNCELTLDDLDAVSAGGHINFGDVFKQAAAGAGIGGLVGAFGGLTGAAIGGSIGAAVGAAYEIIVEAMR
jgi:hypothetical protein